MSVVRKGKEGAELIQKMMVEFRANPPKTILGSPVVKINDFLTLETTDVKSGAMTPIVQDRSNVLQWFTEDGTTVSVRPSGTEPKIKFYFGVKAPLASGADFDEVQPELDAKTEGTKRDLKREYPRPLLHKAPAILPGLFHGHFQLFPGRYLPRKFVFLNF